MKFPRLLLLILLLTGLSGCATNLLKIEAIKQGATLTDIEYQMVLDNLAMFAKYPDALPWHIKFTQGTVTVNNQINATLTYQTAAAITRTIASQPQGSVQQVWQIVPVIDVGQLQKLQQAYQKLVVQSWVHRESVPGGTRLVGHYRDSTIWVDESNLKDLTNATFMVLTAVPIQSGERGIIPVSPQPSIASGQ